jgi:hypothetical protein
VNSLEHGGEAVVTPNQESVKEIQVLSSTYSAGRRTQHRRADKGSWLLILLALGLSLVQLKRYLKGEWRLEDQSHK